MIINMNGAKAPETPSPVLQEKTITPETLPTVVGADEGYDGLSQVTVNPDTNLKAENIRSGKTIFGVVGTFEGVEKPFYTGDLSAVTLGSDGVSSVTVNVPVGEPITLESAMPYIRGSSANFIEIYMTSKNDVGNSTYVVGYARTGTNESTSTTAYHIVHETNATVLYQIPVDTTGISSSTDLKVSYKGRFYVYVYITGTGTSTMKYGIILDLGEYGENTTRNPLKGNNADDIVQLFLRIPVSIDANIPVGYLSGRIEVSAIIFAEDLVIEVTR